jgi:hypothetical protein
MVCSVLTDRETVPAVFAATAWRAGWVARAERVRRLALGLGAAGVVGMPPSGDAALAVLAAGGVLDLDLAPAVLDEPALLEAGRAIDQRDPDAFEAQWSAVAPDDDALRGDGGATWSHREVLWAARSFAQGVGAGPGTTISIQDGALDGARDVVVRLLVPVVSGAVVVDGVADVCVRRGEYLGVAGCAGPVSAGAPLPGVTIAVDDDGAVLVRAGSAARDRRDDEGWVRA